MNNFKQYKRKGLSEMISVKEFIANGGDMTKVSVSVPDQGLAVSKPHEFDQGFIARNNDNHEDLWYVSKDYFDKNLEEVGDKTQPMPSQQPIQNPTFGQKAVGINFNPSGDDQVGQCKQAFANEIDRMNDLRHASMSPEQKRLCSVAITELQTAQMWAVKALTWKD